MCGNSRGLKCETDRGNNIRRRNAGIEIGTPMSAPDKTAVKIVCQNRKARHEYQLEDRFEAGLVLTGTEVKSLRQGKGSLAESYARAVGEELFIIDFHIPPYEQGNIHNTDPVRPRKLLLHRREINKMIGAASRQGFALVPVSVYFKNGRAKVEIALGKGKKMHDKREDMKKRDQEREMRRKLSR